LSIDNEVALRQITVTSGLPTILPELRRSARFPPHERVTEGNGLDRMLRFCFIPKPLISNKRRIPMKRIALSLSLVVLILGSNAFADDMSALKQEVQALQTTVAALQASNATLQTSNAKLQGTVALPQASNSQLSSTVMTLQTGLNAVENNSVLTLNGKLGLQSDGVTALFSGVNVQVVNGSGATSTVNGTGNPIVGYNEIALVNAPFFCSDGSIPFQGLCMNTVGGTWGANQRTESHNLVVGRGNSYTQWGGLVAGEANVINAPLASVTGGNSNQASSMWSSVSGGNWNYAFGSWSRITGGYRNFTAESGSASSIGGGLYNQANGQYGSVSGGQGNTAGGQSSSVSGEVLNTPSGFASNVSGGYQRTASGTYNWVAGALLEPQ
jgi:cell division protein FtsB